MSNDAPTLLGSGGWDSDDDDDTILDGVDACPGYDDLSDADSDGAADGCDICPNDFDNDLDGDGV